MNDIRDTLSRIGRRHERYSSVPLVRFATVALIIIFGMWLGRIAMQNDVIREMVVRYGYGGIFVIALISGFNIVVPVPAVAFVPLFVASGMDFAATVGVIVVGVTVADLVAYLLGRAGRELDVMKHGKMVKRLAAWRAKHYWTPIWVMGFYAAFAPLPNELIAIPLGLMNYPLRHVVPPLLLGNLVFNLLASYGMRAVFLAL
jgi:membrane protein YqaA with SNARE-associated domain